MEIAARNVERDVPKSLDPPGTDMNDPVLLLEISLDE